MRELIIKSLDMIVWFVAGLMAVGGVLGGLFALAQGEVVGLAFIIGGLVYAVVFAGGFFMAIGIYENTKRTAAAVERMASR